MKYSVFKMCSDIDNILVKYWQEPRLEDTSSEPSFIDMYGYWWLVLNLLCIHVQVL